MISNDFSALMAVFPAVWSWGRTTRLPDVRYSPPMGIHLLQSGRARALNCIPARVRHPGQYGDDHEYFTGSMQQQLFQKMFWDVEIQRRGEQLSITPPPHNNILLYYLQSHTLGLGHSDRTYAIHAQKWVNCRPQPSCRLSTPENLAFGCVACWFLFPKWIEIVFVRCRIRVVV